MSKENLYLHLVLRVRKVHMKDGGIFTSFTFIRKFFKSAAFKRRRMSGSWYFSRIKFKNLKIVNLWQTINRMYHLDTNISLVKLNVIFRDMELKMEKMIQITKRWKLWLFIIEYGQAVQEEKIPVVLKFEKCVGFFNSLKWMF